MRKLPLIGESRRQEGAAGVDASVLVTVTGALDDAGALRFATVLAEAMDIALWRAPGLAGPGICVDVVPAGEHAVVAVGSGLTERLEARLRIVVSGGVPRAAWRDRALAADLELADPREGVARGLAPLLKALLTGVGTGSTSRA